MFIQNLQDLAPILAKGVVVVFHNHQSRNSQGVLLMGNHKWRKYNINLSTYEVWIGTDDSVFERKYAPRQTTLLEEQQATLVYELIHALNGSRGFEISLGPFLYLLPIGGMSENQKRYTIEEYEALMEAEAYRLIQDNDFLEKLVWEISERPNCCFIYEVAKTPFLDFHISILKKHSNFSIPIL